MAGEEIKRTQWARLLRLVSRYSSGYGDAEDLLHSAFIRLERYRVDHPVENPSAFLVRTATNLAIDNHRHESFWEPCDERRDRQCADDAPLQDEIIAARARLHRVKEGLAKLSPRTREIFLMHRLHGLKYREIAARCGISQSAVEKHIAKAALFLSQWVQDW
jgi:RNA polymerase sigma factor (sigma-70 family)